MTLGRLTLHARELSNELPRQRRSVLVEGRLGGSFHLDSRYFFLLCTFRYNLKEYLDVSSTDALLPARSVKLLECFLYRGLPLSSSLRSYLNDEEYAWKLLR